MRVILKRIMAVFLISVVLLSQSISMPIQAEDVDFQLHAHAAILMDGDNGRVLWEMNGQEQRAMASTTKIMTSIITLEYGNLEDEVTISKKAASAPEVKLHIREGEKYTLGDLLYALMLESSNDVAVAIAEHVGGSVEEFGVMMTEKAKDIGAHNTSYKTPNGLDAEGHYSTAYDLALIARYALNNEDFVNIINTRQKEFYELTNNRYHMVHNKNAFLDMMDGAIGVKTGFTSQAGYCFVGAVKKDGKFFIAVVLASGWPPNRLWKFQDTEKIIKYALDHYEYQQIVEEEESRIFEPIYVIDGQIEFVEVEMLGTIGLLMNGDEKIRKEIDIPITLQAPVQSDVTIGYMSIYINDELYQMLPIKTTQSVKKIDYRFCLDIIIEEFLLKGRLR